MAKSTEEKVEAHVADLKAKAKKKNPTYQRDGFGRVIK